MITFERNGIKAAMSGIPAMVCPHCVVRGISLYRIHWLGLAYLWEDLPRVKEFAQRAYKRPCVWEDVINWPSPMPPLPYTADIS